MSEDLAIVNGIRIGGLVEICDLDAAQIETLGQDVNGELGQVVGYEGDIGKFHIFLVCGAAGFFEPKNVRLATVLKPGEGGDEHSFDMIMAPKTDGSALASEISTCLLEKGFCVLKICQSAQKMEPTMEKLRSEAEEGNLSRLPEEVEPGYLGANCQAKCAWFDYDKEGDYLTQDENLLGMDGNLSYLAEIIQPFTIDLFDGDYVDERTPALLYSSLTQEEEAEFPWPEADDKVLGSFLSTWRRTLLRAVHFSGPGTATVHLLGRDTPKAATMPQCSADLSLAASPNTILLFRPDVYDYTCDAPEETLMMMSNFLSAAPLMNFSYAEGAAWTEQVGNGPPPPPGPGHIYVMNTVQRLPGRMDTMCYMAALVGATDSVQKIPFLRGDVDPYFTSDPDTVQGWQTVCKHGAFAESVELFDNKHFEISNSEAAGMDPTQRLLLETGAQSLAMEGYTKKMMNRTATHAGFAVGNDHMAWQTMPKDIPAGACTGTGTALSILANRFNFVFNMKGPSFVCDTACSSSLTSTHCIKKCLLDRDIDVLDFVISMGTQLLLDAIQSNIGGSQAHMNSAKGRCFTFNSTADGYLRSEGVSGFMMKFGSLRGASEGILRGTAIGQDGRSASLTAPNGPAQEQIISKAIKEAHMVPPESTVWECHGTGTSLGDPIEVGSVRKVQIRMPRQEPLMITSVKTNMGHAEGGAAMAAMCKCIIQCRAAKCLSTTHLRCLNPHLEHEAFDAIFQTENARYAFNSGHSQVSSFGFGGSNGHGLFWGENLDEAPDRNVIFSKKLDERPAPEVRIVGNHPDQWDADFPDTRSIKKGAKYHISIDPNDVSEAIKWELVEGEDEEDDDGFYALTGNFNNWSVDGQERMEPGNIDGLHLSVLEIPDSGILEFHILKDGDEDQVIAPATTSCGSKTEAVLAPEKGTKNKWSVLGQPGQEVSIEFLAKGGTRTIFWMLGEVGEVKDE
mmetsp:Transcript_133308/g.285041  ORF Transcript_133308/g.285041 Transcript_133308/m.285041 type:complete len:962 (-) Transcript_133308:62-2947(-)